MLQGYLVQDVLLYANLDCFGRVDGFLLAGREVNGGNYVSSKQGAVDLHSDKGCSAIWFRFFCVLDSYFYL